MRTPYYARYAPLVVTTSVDDLLAMAADSEAKGYYPEAHTYLRRALLADATD